MGFGFCQFVLARESNLVGWWLGAGCSNLPFVLVLPRKGWNDFQIGEIRLCGNPASARTSASSPAATRHSRFHLRVERIGHPNTAVRWLMARLSKVDLVIQHGGLHHLTGCAGPSTPCACRSCRRPRCRRDL